MMSKSRVRTLNGSSIPTRKCSPKFATIRRNQLNIDFSKIRKKKQQKNPKKTQPLLKMMSLQTLLAYNGITNLCPKGYNWKQKAFCRVETNPRPIKWSCQENFKSEQGREMKHLVPLQVH